MRNIAEMLRLRCVEMPNKEAIIFKNTRLTWLQFYKQSSELALALKKLGTQKHERVAIYAPHSLAQAVSIFGISMASGVFSVINPLLKEENIFHQIKDGSFRFIVGTKEFLATIEHYAHQNNIVTVEINEIGQISANVKTEINPESDFFSNIPADVANIIYTSGSTGYPKGVVVPQRTLVDGARIVSSYLKITEKDKILSILPYGFDYGLNQLLSTVFKGATIVIHDHFLPSDLFKILQEEKITGFAAVPAIWPAILSDRFKSSKKSNFENLRYVTTAGGFHSQETLKSLDDFFPHSEIIVMYGLTESFRSAYLPYSEIFKRHGCIGKAVPEVELYVIDEAGNRLLPRQKGELVHRGAFVTYGYLNNPELTNKKFIKLNTPGAGCLPEIAVKSGDLVEMDEEGFIYFHGRIDNLIKLGGYRISPDEITEAVEKNPEVTLAATFATSDKNFKQTVYVAYQTKSGTPIDHQCFKTELLKILPNYAIPSDYIFYAQIPLNQNGKIDFGQLKKNIE